MLSREINRLMDESFKAQLSENGSKNLIKYLNFIRDFKEPGLENPAIQSEPIEEETEAFSDLSDEELKKLTKRGEPNV